MTQDDIIRMAKEATKEAPREDWNSAAWVFGDETLERFAALVAEREREECAKVCEDIEMQGHALWKRTYDPDAQGRATGAADCAAAIRARGGV